MRVMLHNRMKLSGYSVFEKLDLNDPLTGLENILIEGIQTIAIAKVIPLSSNCFVFRILLSQVMVSQFSNRHQTLHESVQVAIEVVVTNAYYSIT